MAKNIKEIKEEIRDLICNNPNYMMIDKIEVLDKEPTVYFINEKRETYRTVDITLKPAFYFNASQKNNKSFSLRFKDDKKNHLESEWLSRDLNNALSEAYVKDYYLYYDPKEYLDMETVDANLYKLADEFFGQDFGSLNNKERTLVYQYANKAKYQSPGEIISAFNEYYESNGHLPYQHDELNKMRVSATNHGYLDTIHNQAIDGILAKALILFVINNKRWPRKNEPAYENLYLPVIAGYQNNLYCSPIMESLDYFHMCYRKVSIGQMIFDSIMQNISLDDKQKISKKDVHIKYYDFDDDEVKYYYRHCYNKQVSYYDNYRYNFINKNYFIIFKGFMDNSDNNLFLHKLHKRNSLFEEYCNNKDIPLLIIDNQNLNQDDILALINNKNREVERNIEADVMRLTRK